MPHDIPEITLPPQVYERLAWMREHYDDGDIDEMDALDALQEACGRNAAGGWCINAGSAECDECIFRAKD